MLTGVCVLIRLETMRFDRHGEETANAFVQEVDTCTSPGENEAKVSLCVCVCVCVLLRTRASAVIIDLNPNQKKGRNTMLISLSTLAMINDVHGSQRE